MKNICSVNSWTKNRGTLCVVCLLVVTFQILLLELSKSKGRRYFAENLSPAKDDLFRIEVRPDLIDIINSTEFDKKYPLKLNSSYRLENKTLCSPASNIITILVIILSSAKNCLNRQVLRRTWANGSLYSSYEKVRTLFLLGLTNEPSVQAKIEEEFQRFGDILQGSFVDSYHNLTHKSIMGYKWVTERCRNVRYVIKTDDDIVINMYRIVQNHVLERTLERHHVFCKRLFNSRVIRYKKSKFFVEAHQFKGMNNYHPYCDGQFVAMLNDVIPYLYAAAKQTPTYWIDDVYMYGLVMNSIHTLNYSTIQGNETGKYSDSKSLKCLKVKKAECPIIYFLTNNINQVEKLWSTIEDVYP